MGQEQKNSRIDVDRVKREVVGKWRGVLASIGVELRSDGKHQPCPLCGGTDRFRFDDVDGNGTWYCNQCDQRSGDGWYLYQKKTNTDFLEAVEQVSKIIGSIDYIPQQNIEKPDPKIAITKVWKSSTPLTGEDLATKYLRSRGLVVSPKNLRFSNKCYESDTKSNMSAMIGVVMNREGRLVTLHRTYLNGPSKADIQSPKKLMPATVDSLSECSAAIRLFDVKDVVGVAEGIETAIACKQLFDIPTWATISTSIMAGFEPPEGIRKVVIFGDCDANFVGQKAAYILANKLFLKDYIVEVQIPSIGDWADEVQGKIK